MCTIDNCEKNDWLFGAKGHCNNVTNLCECPEGYTGDEPFLHFEDCHVNIVAVEILFAIGLVVSILALPVIIAYMISVQARITEAREKLGSTSSPNSLSSKSDETILEEYQPGVSTSCSSSPSPFKLQIMRIQMFSMVGFTVNIICNIPLLAYVANSDNNLSYSFPSGIWILHGVAWITLWSACWSYLYTLWKSIPDWSILCSLLRIKAVFVTHPKFSFYVAVSIIALKMCFWLTATCILAFFSTRAPGSKLNYHLFVSGVVLSMICLAVFQVPSSILISRIYQKALDSHAIKRDRERKKVSDAIWMLRNIALGGSAGALFAILVLFAQWSPLGERVVWLWIAISCISNPIHTLTLSRNIKLNTNAKSS